jgi:methyltransferase (TIGR00027 family)
VIGNGQPSQTALTAAAARAAHLIVDNKPPIFSDTLAYQLLGDQAEELIGFHRAHGEHVVLSGARTAVTTRSRYTEDRLAESLRRETAGGVAQYVILGAGLDSFAYRSELTEQVRVFEVDHPATQQWKLQLLTDAGIATPETATFVPVDFETDSLADQLIDNGFDPSQPALVSWLGVTMYLTREAIGQTLAVVGGFAPGTEIIVDYMVPADLRDEAGQAYVDLLAPVTAERGEPWLTFLGPQDMSALLEERGFEVIEHVRQRDAIDAALWNRSDPLRAYDLSLLARASVRRSR